MSKNLKKKTNQSKEDSQMSEQDKKNKKAFDEEQGKMLSQGKKDMSSQIKTSPPATQNKIGVQSKNQQQKEQDDHHQSNLFLKEDQRKPSLRMNLSQPKNVEVYKNDPKILQEIKNLKLINEKLNEQIVYFTDQLKDLDQLKLDAEQYDPPKSVIQLYNDLLEQQVSAKHEYQEIYQKYQKLRESIQPQQQSMNSEDDVLIDDKSGFKEGSSGSILLQQNKVLQEKIEYLEMKLLNSQKNQDEMKIEFQTMKMEFQKMKIEFQKMKMEYQSKQTEMQKQIDWIIQEKNENKAIIVRSEIINLFIKTYIRVEKKQTEDVGLYFSTNYESKNSDLDNFATKLGINEKEWRLIKQENRNIEVHPSLQRIKEKIFTELYTTKIFQDDNENTYQAFLKMIEFIENNSI